MRASRRRASVRTPNGTWHPDYLPYQGVGAWVDAYDYVDGYQTTGKPAPLHVDVLATMAQQGVKTVYLQVAKEDPALAGRSHRSEPASASG